MGGSHKSQQSSYEVFGVQNQSRVVTEGIDHTEGVGGTGFYEDYFANEEYSISALGSDVEMNSGGAAIVAIGKSGGNDFSGLVPHHAISQASGSATTTTTSCAREDSPATQICCSGKATPTWVDRSSATRSGFSARTTISRSTRSCRAFRRSSRPTSASSTISRARARGRRAPTTRVIGYYQQGRKQKPQRGLSSLRPPESIQAQDSWSSMYKGEFQRVMSNRAFLDVTVGNFTLNWPMVPAVDPAARPPQVFRDTGAVAGAGWNSFTTGRKKPQVKAQLTYFLPKGGSHDFKFGFENIYDWYRFGINGSNGPIRYSYPRAGAAPDRIRFADTGANSDFETTWRSSPNTDLHYAFYGQDRWTRDRLSITGRRSHRLPEARIPGQHARS